jgi:spermidine synthase
VGVVGLGVGTLAAYGRSGDEFDFFEINPLVISYAKSDFYYLADSAATCRIIPGDARISLDRFPPQGYDVLALDAFSSDAVPIHLLTEEAMEVYLKHMRDGGIIAAHVSNRYFDLLPVLAGHAERFQLTIAAINDSGDVAKGIDSSTWVLLTRDPSALTRGDLERKPRLPISRRLHWTDAHSSLLPVLVW